MVFTVSSLWLTSSFGVQSLVILQALKTESEYKLRTTFICITFILCCKYYIYFVSFKGHRYYAFLFKAPKSLTGFMFFRTQTEQEVNCIIYSFCGYFHTFAQQKALSLTQGTFLFKKLFIRNHFNCKTCFCLLNGLKQQNFFFLVYMDISHSNAHSTPGNMFEYFILKFTEQWSKYVMRKKHTLVCIHNKELFTQP